MRWIKLTLASNDSPIYVQTSNIVTLYVTGGNTEVVFVGDIENYIRVKESPEKILESLGESCVALNF